MTFTTHVLHGDADLIDNLAAEWSTLCKGRYDEPFYRPEWIGAYTRAFLRGKRLIVITARLNGVLVGLLPLVREWGTLDGIPARKLRAAANAHTCRYDLVHDCSVTHGVVTAVWQGLRKVPGWDVLELTDVPHGAAVSQLARIAHADGCPAHVAPRALSPYLPLHEPPLQDRLNAKFRANLHRRRRKLQARAPLDLICTRTFDQHVEQFYALEQRGWKGEEGSAIACEPATRSFYDMIAQIAATNGTLALYSLEAAGRPVAMHFGLMQSGRYYLLKTAYDESLRECSPGQLITYDVLHDLSNRGCAEFDFLGPLMEWKRAWKPRLRPHADWFVFRGWTGAVLHTLRFRLRPTLGRLLRGRRTPRES